MLGSTWKNIFILLYFLNGLVSKLCYAKNTCNSIFVRWPRVRLNLNPAVDGAFSYPACKSACVHDEDPVKAGSSQQCSAFNHKNGPNQFTHHCQIYPKDQVQHIDGYVEADDRYSFYWKYCVDSERTCAGEYAFTFLSDRYMAAQEVIRVYYSKTLEDCLAECLNEKSFLCRSVSFNRTDGGCHLSMQNQLSKPALLKLNNNPNFRIDYYENNCFNIVDSFTFDYKCEKEGIRVFVDSKFPYSGALYGLYDFFTCRVEPKESRKFEYMFPYPTVSKNCSDSIRYKGSEMILEVVLSTDGIEPLYFITPDDLTYQARCPIQIEVVETTNNIEENNIDSTALNVLENSGKENTDTSAQNLVKMLTETALIKSQKIQMDVANATKLPETTMKTLKPFTKDVFALPLNPKFTTTKQPEDTTTTILSSTLTTEQRSTPISDTTITSTTNQETTSTPISKLSTTSTVLSTLSTTPSPQKSQTPTKSTNIIDANETKSKSSEVSKPKTFQIVEEGFINTVKIDFSTKKSTSEEIEKTTVEPKLAEKTVTKSSETTVSSTTFTTPLSEIQASTSFPPENNKSFEKSEILQGPSLKFKFRTAQEISTPESSSSSSPSLTTPSTTIEPSSKSSTIVSTVTTILPTSKLSTSSEKVSTTSSTNQTSTSSTTTSSNKILLKSTIYAITPDFLVDSKITTKRAIPVTTIPRFPGVSRLTGVRNFFTPAPFSPPITHMTNFPLVKQHSYALLTTTKPFRFSTHISFPVKGGIGIGSVKELGESKNKDVLEGHGDDPNFSTLAESTASPTTTREPTTTNPTTTPTTITTTTTKKVTITSPTTTSTTPSTTTSTTTTSTSTTTTPKPTTTPSTTSTTTTKTTTSTSPTPPPTTSTSVLTTTWKAKPPAPEAPVAPPGIGIPPHLRFINENGTLTRQPQPPGNKKPNEAVMFDIFHHGQPAEAVVVGSRITLSFTPYYAIPPAFMHISGCQVEPIASLYEWEKEPLAIVKEGCQSDHVGLVCPPQKTDYGIRVMVEAFRYQSTTQIQYTCLIRVCPFAPCPQTTCPTVEGCPGEQASGLLSPLFNLRSKRDESLAQLRARWAGTPYYQEPLTLPNQPPERMSSTLRQQLMLLGGDHIVRKRLIVVNSEEELQFFVRTGEIPPNQIR